MEIESNQRLQPASTRSKLSDSGVVRNEVFFGVDAAGGGEVDAEGFLGEEVFAGGQDIAIQLLMQVVRDGFLDVLNPLWRG